KPISSASSAISTVATARAYGAGCRAQERTRECGLVITGIKVARLPLDLPLRCRCGHVRGVASEISSSTGCRVLCYCKDCQAFARFLELADVLDAAGGTDIFQMPPGRVKLSAGMDAVRCLRLSNRGIYRWYTDCCRTPIGNTAGPRVPLIGLI